MGDRFEDFKADTAAQLEYRKAYATLASADPGKALTLPHPEEHGLDAVKALELIRAAGGTLKADPKLDIRS